MYEQVRQNKRRSVLLILGFVALVVALGAATNVLFGYGPVWVVIALVIAAISAFAAYWRSDSIALALSRAKPADEVTYARLHNLVEGLCIAGGLPKPRVYIIDDPSPNAFAV